MCNRECGLKKSVEKLSQNNKELKELKQQLNDCESVLGMLKSLATWKVEPAHGSPHATKVEDLSIFKEMRRYQEKYKKESSS